jgi:PAS domain S-box-containing protein
VPADPYAAETVRRVAARAPLAFGVFLVCTTISTVFEVLRFPERRAWMLGFYAGFVALVAIGFPLIRRRPALAVPVLVVFVNAIGVGLNVYHAVVAAPVAMDMLVVTALLATSAVILPWGQKNQALASVGAFVSYPLMLLGSPDDPLVWAVGGTYLLAVIAIGTYGAGLFARHIRTGVELSAALTEREARLQSYFDLSLVGTAIVTAAGICREVNEELLAMFGCSREAVVGQPWWTLVEPDDCPVAEGLLAQAVAGAPERIDLRCRRADGTTIHCVVAARGLPAMGGQLDHALVLIHDITDRRRTEIEREVSLARAEAARQQAEATSRAKDALLATVSHELRTPLTPIIAWADMLSENALDADGRARALGAIKRNAKAQVALIDDLLDLSRLVAGNWQETLRPVELAAVARAALEMIEPDARAKGLGVVVAPCDQPLVVKGDPERLRQAVLNLLGNAIKFTPRGGRVSVTLRASRGKAILCVRDTGQGIDAAVLPEIFEPFRQGDSSSSRRHGGLGLGLSIVRALVERHGGTVQATSEGPDRGAAFFVELPLLPVRDADAALADPRPTPPVRSERSGSRAVLHGLRVLVVDDDPDSNAVIGSVLVSRGAQVRTALSAEQGLRVAEEWRPQVILSDIAMPEQDGIELLRAIRQRRDRLGEVPTVAVTAYSSAEDRQRILDAGFHAYVAKPFDAVHLAAVVETAAHASRVLH